MILSYKHSVTLQDQNKNVSCILDHALLPEPLVAQRQITVSTGPSTVSVSPDPMTLTENVETTLSCVAEKVEPSGFCDFEVKLGDEKIPSSKLEITDNESPSFGFSSRASTYTFSPTHLDHGKDFSCLATNQKNGEEKRNKRKLSVNFAPRISCQTEELAEEFRVNCNVIGYPKPGVDNVIVGFNQSESTSRPSSSKTTQVTKTATSEGVILNFTRTKDSPIQHFYISAKSAGASASLSTREFNLTRTALPPRELLLFNEIGLLTELLVD